MSLFIGASHCEIDAKVLKEVGLEMHLHTHSEGFRDGLVGTFLAAEGVGLAQPLVPGFHQLRQLVPMRRLGEALCSLSNEPG